MVKRKRKPKKKAAVAVIPNQKKGNKPIASKKRK
jgi:hypothetical protein